MADAKTLIDVQGLKTYFHTEDGVVKAVDDISIQIAEGHTLGLVGESGSGKSVTSLTIMQLLPEVSSKIEGGSISFLGQDLVKLPPAEMRKIRGSEISMIFQEPGTSLNPVYRVGSQVVEAIMLHQDVAREEAEQRAVELFDEVGIPEPERRVNSYPHEMSGGQKQRVMIAMALSCNPKLLIADEPTTALDVTIQKQILDLIRELRDQRGMSILFITHDLGVIAEIADDVAVMFQGKVVEYKPILEIFENPQHPYTKGLLACRPRLSSVARRLPTVADFMETRPADDGSVEMIEKEISEQKMAALVGRGRGRLLHPAKELERLGYPSDPADYGADTTLIPDDQEPALKVRGLKVHFPIRKGLFSKVQDYVRAVDGIDFDVYPGQTLGLVGESGCGKTTTGRAILRLVHTTEGEVFYQGQSMFELRGEELRNVRRQVQIIFQDPYASLNPRMTVESMLTEAMKVHRLGNSRLERRQRAARLLEEVGLEMEHLGRYPHEFSGGQRQRICIARALAVEPSFIICDESVSALDVSVQAQVLNLLKDLQETRGLTYIFISHDLSVVKFMSDMMAVMNDGLFVEFGPSDAIYENPREEYTQRLISATPKDTVESIRQRVAEREKTRGNS
ncbi:MAG: ABC transporter ATP-binding protein [Planctomycetota bacterium]|nr:ABC transporter ATP-binding protein [Planctomycetota bacterium]